MSDRDDHSYFRERARQEREIALTCEDNSAALAHLRMADEYERRISEPASGRHTSSSLQSGSLSALLRTRHMIP
jgi:hypothetical protein